MDLPVHLGEMRLFLIMCVTHARWRSLAVQQLEGNTFRDRLRGWQAVARDEKIVVVKYMSPVASSWWETIWHTLGESVLGAGSSQLCCLCLFTCAKCVSSVLQHLCPVTTYLVYHLPVAPAGARGWRCISNSSELLWPWTVGGEEPKFLSGRKSKCLKIKIHL